MTPHARPGQRAPIVLKLQFHRRLDCQLIVSAPHLPTDGILVARIFLVLAILAVILLLANLTVGLAKGDFGKTSASLDAAKQAYESLEASPDVTLDQIAAARQRVSDAGRQMVDQREPFWIHVWLGIIAVLVNLLVNSISITYFIGTSRWCTEVVDAYELDPDLADQSRRLKRRSFPWAFLGILLTLGIASLGAAADPYASTASPSTWVSAHWMLAIGGTVVIAVAFLSQVMAVSANYQVINTILVHVEERRAGLRAAGSQAAGPQAASSKAEGAGEGAG